MKTNHRKILFEPLISGNLNAIIPDCCIKVGKTKIQAPGVIALKRNHDFELTLHFLQSRTPPIFDYGEGRSMGEGDKIPIKGQIVGEIAFEALIFPCGQRTSRSRGTSSVTISADKLDLIPENDDLLTTNEILAKIGDKQLPEEECEKKFSAHIIFHGPKLGLLDSGTEVSKINDFLGKSTSSSFDTHRFSGVGWEGALIQNGNELHLHIRNTESSDQKIDDPVDLVDRICLAVAFTHGFQPWPVYREIRIDHRIVERWMSANLNLRQSMLAPISQRLGMTLHTKKQTKLSTFIPVISEGFGKMAVEQRDNIKTLIWNVLSSDLGNLPPSTKLLILCSALDGIMKIIGGDSKNTMKTWKSAATVTDLSWDNWLSNIMNIRKNYRDHLSHGRLWILENNIEQGYFKDYPQLGCAFMIMIAAFCGYEGPVIANPFESKFTDISSLMQKNKSFLNSKPLT